VTKAREFWITEDWVAISSNQRGFFPDEEIHLRVIELTPDIQRKLNQYDELDQVFIDQTEELRACVVSFDDGRYLGRKLSSAIVEEYRALKDQNEKLLNCVEFYATRGNWHEGDNKNIYLDDCIDINDCEESDGLKEGGKLARQVLKELGEK
jgi:hypothetical protein